MEKVLCVTTLPILHYCCSLLFSVYPVCSLFAGRELESRHGFLTDGRLPLQQLSTSTFYPSTTHTAMNLLLSSLIFPLISAFAANDYVVLQGHKIQNDYSSPLPHEYIAEEDLPEAFNWGDIEGRSYLTRMLNQHLPQV